MADFGCPLAYLQNMVDADALPVEVLNAIKEQTNKTKVVAGYSLSALWKMNKKQSIPMLFAALQEVGDLQREIKKLKEENKKLKNDLRLCAEGLIPHDLIQRGIVETCREKVKELEEEIKKLKEENWKLQHDHERPMLSYKTFHSADSEDYIGWVKGCGIYQKLEAEVEELKDFSNWENHPALKHKVVLDDDYYTAHLDEYSELIPPAERDQLKEENKKLKAKIEKFKQILTQE